MSSATRRPLSSSQAGSMLLEGLIAILIFSLGILAIVGMQGSAIKASTDAKYRTDAGLLANRLIGSMWASGRTTADLQANFNSPDGGSYKRWRTEVQNQLPGADLNPPTVAVDAAGIATVTIRWVAPSEPAGTAPHRFIMTAQVK